MRLAAVVDADGNPPPPYPLLRRQGLAAQAHQLVLALWDGEEFGLMGSTEWVEKHQTELERSGAVYINVDQTGRGQMGASGSHSLESVLHAKSCATCTELTAGVRSILDSVRIRQLRCPRQKPLSPSSISLL